MSASTSAVLQPGALAAPRARGASSHARRAARVRASRRDDSQIFARASSKADGESAGDDDDATAPEARGVAGDDAREPDGALLRAGFAAFVFVVLLWRCNDDAYFEERR